MFNNYRQMYQVVQPHAVASTNVGANGPNGRSTPAPSSENLPDILNEANNNHRVNPTENNERRHFSFVDPDHHVAPHPPPRTIFLDPSQYSSENGGVNDLPSSPLTLSPISDVADKMYNLSVLDALIPADRARFDESLRRLVQRDVLNQMFHNAATRAYIESFSNLSVNAENNFSPTTGVPYFPHAPKTSTVVRTSSLSWHAVNSHDLPPNRNPNGSRAVAEQMLSSPTDSGVLMWSNSSSPTSSQLPSYYDALRAHIDEYISLSPPACNFVPPEVPSRPKNKNRVYCGPKKTIGYFTSRPSRVALHFGGSKDMIRTQLSRRSPHHHNCTHLTHYSSKNNYLCELKDRLSSKSFCNQNKAVLPPDSGESIHKRVNVTMWLLKHESLNDVQEPHYSIDEAI